MGAGQSTYLAGEVNLNGLDANVLRAGGHFGGARTVGVREKGCSRAGKGERGNLEKGGLEKLAPVGRVPRSF